jgi:uncharacterized DUF497 family protein
MNFDNVEWDPNKAAENLRKHGVSFLTAMRVFGDRRAIHDIDDSMDYGEERCAVLGIAHRQILFVIYTERNEKIRIISARQATRREHDLYYRENSQI